eukprot:759212_1
MTLAKETGLYTTIIYVVLFIIAYHVFLWRISSTLIKQRKEYDVETPQQSIFRRVLIENWKMKSVFAAILPRVIDSATDIGTIVEFYRLSTSDTDESKQINSVIDTKDLFIASLLIFLVSKLLCASLIFRFTRRVSYFIMEIFDLLSLKMILNMYQLRILGIAEKSNTWRYLVVIETLYETAPQMLISMTFTLRTSSIEINPIVFASFFVALWTITRRITITESIRVNANRYMMRVIYWRYFELSSRVLVCSWLWVIIGAVSVCTFLVCEVVIFAFIAYYQQPSSQRNLDVLLERNMLFYITEIEESNIYWRAVLYRISSSLLLLILITVFIFVDYENNSFWNVPRWAERRRDSLDNTVGTVLFLYCWVSTLIWPLGMTMWYFAFFVESGSDTRDLNELIKAQRWIEVLELLEFGAEIDDFIDEKLIYYICEDRDDDDFAKITLLKRMIKETPEIVNYSFDYQNASIVGGSPLHYACNKSSEEMVKLFVSNGADVHAVAVSAQDRNLGTIGQLTPINIAKYRGDQTIIEYLQNQ